MSDTDSTAPSGRKKLTHLAEQAAEASAEMSTPIRGPAREEPVVMSSLASTISALSEAEPVAEVEGPARGPLRAAESRERAKRRVEALRKQIDDLPEGLDEFYIPADIVPDGWSYEWKRYTLLNAQDPTYQVALAQTGWDPVPAERHPTLMPLGWDKFHIERKGMILMERPLEITQEMKRRDDKNARDAVRQKADQLGQAPPGTFQRQDAKGGNLAKVSVGYESGVMIPD
jgi:hypothetical protein